jgi:hypothetical protein
MLFFNNQKRKPKMAGGATIEAIIKQYLLSSWHLESKSRPKIRVEDQAINKRLEHLERTLRTHQRKHLREHGDLLRAFRIVRT